MSLDPSTNFDFHADQFDVKHDASSVAYFKNLTAALEDQLCDMSHDQRMVIETYFKHLVYLVFKSSTSMRVEDLNSIGEYINLAQIKFLNKKSFELKRQCERQLLVLDTYRSLLKYLTFTHQDDVIEAPAIEPTVELSQLLDDDDLVILDNLFEEQSHYVDPFFQPSQSVEIDQFYFGSSEVIYQSGINYQYAHRIKRKYPTLRDLALATRDEILSLPGIGHDTMTKISNFFRRHGKGCVVNDPQFTFKTNSSPSADVCNKGLRAEAKRGFEIIDERIHYPLDPQPARLSAETVRETLELMLAQIEKNKAGS